MIVQKTYQLSFSPERVFAAWISDDFAVPPITSVEVDPRVGGVFLLKSESDGAAGEMRGEILQISPGEYLEYTWSWDKGSTPSIVEARFSDCDGGCQIDVSHSGLESAESAAAHASGWDAYVGALEQLLGKATDTAELRNGR